MKSDSRRSYFSQQLSGQFAYIVQRQPSLTDLKLQLVDLLSVPGWLFSSGVGILLYVTLLNAFKCDANELIANGYTDPDLHKALPNVIWYAFIFGCARGYGSSQAVLSFMCACTHPDIRLTPCQYLSLSIYCFVTLFVTALLVTCAARRALAAAVSLVVGSLFIFTGYVLKFNCRRYDRERGQLSAWSNRIKSALKKVAFILILGLLLTTVTVMFGFAVVQQFLEESLPQDGSFSTSILQSGGEILFVSLFFLVWRPVWLKRCAIVCCKLAMCYNEDLSKNQDMIDQVRFIVNFSGDLLFLVYGRGLLLDMSGTIGFVVVFMVAFKANVVHIWNFGFRFIDECIVLTLKMYHPAERQRLDRKWKWITSTIDDFLRLHNLPSKLSVMWNIALDYHEVVSGAHPNPNPSVMHEEPTSICIAIQIIDFKINISNLPQRFDEAPNDDEIVVPSQTCKKPTPSKWLFATKTHPAHVPSTVEGMDPPDIAVTGCPTFPHFPVTVGEKVKLRSLCVEVQAIIFQRYQTLALAKFFTNILFLGAPCAAFATDTRYLPGFRSPLDDTPYGRKYLACGIFFLVTDILEWLIITFGFYYRHEGFDEQLYRYRQLVVTNKWVVRTISLVSAFLGIYWFQMAWDPYADAVFAKKFPEMNIDDVVNICKPFFRE